jgi:predicted nucleic acid-binding protein
MINPRFLVNCDKDFCVSAYDLCSEYGIYAIDALYLKVALNYNAILVSLDKKDFIDRVKLRNPPIEVYHISEFPYFHQD